MNQLPIFLSTEYNRGLPGLPLLNFTLSSQLEASEPPEARGLARDEVRLMVSHIATDQVVHTRFRQIEDFLKPGDVLVINTSGTLNAALPATRSDGTQFELHLSTHLPANLWVVEMRAYQDNREKTTTPFYDIQPGESFTLPAGASVTLHTPYAPGNVFRRLWVASLHLPIPLHPYLDRYGFPIRYSYVKKGWPLSYYQTVFATEPGSAEMPSAGRAFTPELLTRLIAKGIQIVPLLLHTGVASTEQKEPVYEEYYRVPEPTARLINTEGWTDILVTPKRGIRAINGLLTGLHEPLSTHLAMLETLAGRAHLEITYKEALQEGYLWHEFGDLHLMLP